jgi:hypothetical protein
VPKNCPYVEERVVYGPLSSQSGYQRMGAPLTETRNCRKLGLATLTIFLASTCAYSQTVPPDFKKAVCFIFGRSSPHLPNGEPVKGPDGAAVVLQEAPLGTGFFVSYPDPRGGSNFGFVYLVTAKHVLKDWDGRYLQTIKIRLNLKDTGGFDFADVPVTDDKGSLLWFIDEQDSSNEAALYPLLPDQKKFDYKFVPTQMFVTNDTFATANVAEGDRVFFVGLLPQFYGVSRNYPVVRNGTVALITDEKIPVGNIGPHRLYVVEMSAWPGNSGSPVFLQLGGLRGGGLMLGQDIRMLGILLAESNNVMSAKIDKNLQYQWGNGQNTGISYILPAPDLSLVLNNHSAQANRDLQIAALKKN